MISDKQTVQIALSVLRAHGIQHVVISPGSRNAPLTLSFDADPFFQCYSVVDERSAGFFALGIAQQLREPAVLVCTSGSALLNYAPAVAEAFYQKIPLIVLSADRPGSWIDQGDGQTIRQRDALTPHLNFSASLPSEANSADDTWWCNRLVNEAVLHSLGPSPGPVHLNMPFSEPLYRTLSPGEENSAHNRVIERISPSPLLEPSLAEWLEEEIQSAEKVLVICAQLNPDSALNEALRIFSERENTVILAESLSNLAPESVIGCIDRLIMSFDESEEAYFRPNLLVTLGRNLISKKIKTLLRKLRPDAHWHIGSEPGIEDTYQCLNRIIPVSPSVFFEQINGFRKADSSSNYRLSLRKRNDENRSLQQQFIARAPHSDLKVFGEILQTVPEGYMVQLGNSSVVRYVQLFDPSPNLTYFGNRGTSGIDGCVSTAIGAAWVTSGPTLLICGDISFFYDSNALWNNYLHPELKIIVINNGGGGIFRIIEGPEDESVLSTYFETAHRRSAQSLAAEGGMDYFRAGETEDIGKIFSDFFQVEKPALLEIFTPNDQNDKVLKEHFRYIKSNAKRITAL